MIGTETLAQTHIREIVRQVKSGEKNKHLAFEELRGLLRNSVPVDEKNIPPPPSSSYQDPFENHSDNQDNFENDVNYHQKDVDVVDDDLQVNVLSRFSHDDRRLIISKLIEKKRQDRLRGSAEPLLPQQNSRHIDHDLSSIIESDQQSSIQGEQKGHWVTSDSINFTDKKTSIKKSSAVKYLPFWSGQKSKTPIRERPKSAGHSRKISNKSAINITRAKDDSFVLASSARMRRIAQVEAEVVEDMYGNCTFKPHLNPLPDMYNNHNDENIPFYDRVMRWQREKILENERRKISVVEDEDEDCTFHPIINRNSQRAIRDSRNNGITEVVERLYKNSEQSYIQKSKFIEDEIRKERQNEDLECTFKPRLSTKHNQFYATKARYDLKPQRPTEEPLPPSDCTFIPHIKGVAPHMVSAQMYISTDVVERLTRPMLPPPSPDESLKAFDSSFRSMNTGSGGSGSGGRQNKHFGSGDGGNNSSDERITDKTVRDMSFQEFIARQAQTQFRREANIKEGEKKIKVEIVKAIPKSQEILDQHTRGDFFERLSSDKARKKLDTENQSKGFIDPNCTFQPELSEKIKKMRSRSVYELSRGDMLKKETNQRMRRLRNEQEELSHLTFTPAISKLAKDLNKSHLKLHDDPDGFLERHILECREKEELRLRHLHNQELRESEDCTFKPETKDCPAYIRRIAKSLSVVKANRPVAKPSKEDWK
eukprot:gene10060-20960_t